MRPAVIVFAPLLLLPFLACTDTPAEPEPEETASFKAEKPPKDYGDWLVVDVQCSGAYEGCLGEVNDQDTTLDHGFDCQHLTSSMCDDYPPYIETPAIFGMGIWMKESPGVMLCSRYWVYYLSVLDSGPLTRYCLDGDKIVGKVTVTRVIND